MEGRTGERATGRFLAAAAALVVLILLSDLPVAAGPRGLVRGALAPFEVVMTAVAGAAGDVLGVFGDIASLRSQQDRLRAENQALRRQLAEAQAATHENDALRRALNFERTYGHAMVTAQVIARSPEPLARGLTLDRGTADGIRPGMVVASPAGLVGRVIDASPHSARVMTLADPLSRVNAYGARSGLEGTVSGGGESLEMDLPARANAVLAKGEWIHTSGVGGTYPRGLVVGQVTSFAHQDTATVEQAELAWPEDYSALSLVLVITDFRSATAP